MDEKELYIITPKDVQEFIIYNDVKGFRVIEPREVQKRLREQGFDLGELTLTHFLLCMEKDGGYVTIECEARGSVGGIPYNDPGMALDDFVGAAKIHLGKKGPYILIMSKSLYDSDQGDNSIALLEQELGCITHRVPKLVDGNSDEAAR